MVKNINSICVVCYANYCRSPVAEKLLQNKYTDLEIISAGINPFFGKNMDPRSVKFLGKQNILNFDHVPRKITNEIVVNFDRVFAMDTEILINLNNSFPSLKNKFQLFNHHMPSTKIYDPFKMNEDDYMRIMQQIRLVSESLII